MSLLSRFRFGLLSAAALATFAMSSSARADWVDFYTVGTFGAGTSGGAIGGSALNPATDIESSTITIGSSEISYANNGKHTPTPINGFSQVDFGQFTPTSTKTVGSDSFTGSTFTLSLFQYFPTSASGGSLVGAVTGSLVSLGSTVDVQFSPTAFTGIPGFLYTLQNNGLVPINFNSLNDDIPGTVTALPLPSTASAGLVALGGLAAIGGLKKLRERNVASLAV